MILELELGASTVRSRWFIFILAYVIFSILHMIGIYDTQIHSNCFLPLRYDSALLIRVMGAAVPCAAATATLELVMYHSGQPQPLF